MRDRKVMDFDPTILDWAPYESDVDYYDDAEASYRRR